MLSQKDSSKNISKNQNTNNDHNNNEITFCGPDLSTGDLIVFTTLASKIKNKSNYNNTDTDKNKSKKHVPESWEKQEARTIWRRFEKKKHEN